MSIACLMRRLSLKDIGAIWQLSLGCLLMRIIANSLRYTGYLNFISDPKSRFKSGLRPNDDSDVKALVGGFVPDAYL